MSQQNDDGTRKTKNRARQFWMTIAIVTFLVIGLMWGGYWLFFGQFYETTEDAYVSGNLVEVMSNISGQVIVIKADETDFVTEGQILIELEDEDAKINYKAAEDNLALTVRAVNELYKNVEQARANVQLKENNLEKAKEDFDRRKNLTLNQVISEEDLRHYKLSYDAANVDLTLAQKQLEAALAEVENTDLYHHPRVLQAENNLRNAFLALRRTIIYAPATGYVAKRSVQVGQQVTPNTILMIIAPLNEIWIDANFKESELKNIRIGQPATITSDIYGGDVVYKGSVLGLSPGTGSSLDLLPPQNATGNWIKILQRVPVRIKIVNTDVLQKYPLRIGLSVTASVDTHDRKGAKLSQIPQTNTIYQTKDYSIDTKTIDEIIDNIIRSNASNVSVEPNQTNNSIDNPIINPGNHAEDNPSINTLNKKQNGGNAK